jgi:glutamyl-tRNA reductase
MADLALRHLLGHGMRPVTVLSRSVEKASRVARVHGGRSGSLGELPRALQEADVVVSATGATGLVVEREAVAGATTRRDGRPLFLLDLAVPRDVDPAASELPGVTVANIDDLKAVVSGADRAEVEKVRAIVAEEVTRFTGWRRAARLGPVIESLYERGERVRRREMDRVRGRLADLTEDQWAALDSATKAIVAKLLHDPVVRAKARPEGAEHQARLLAELFGLDEPPTA